MRWAASDVSPSSHLAFHIPTLAGFLSFVCLVFCFVALLCFCFLFCKCLGIPNSPRSLDLDDRQGLIASSAMQKKKKRLLRQEGAFFHQTRGERHSPLWWCRKLCHEVSLNAHIQLQVRIEEFRPGVPACTCSDEGFYLVRTLPVHLSTFLRPPLVVQAARSYFFWLVAAWVKSRAERPSVSGVNRQLHVQIGCKLRIRNRKDKRLVATVAEAANKMTHPTFNGQPIEPRKGEPSRKQDLHLIFGQTIRCNSWQPTRKQLLQLRGQVSISSNQSDTLSAKSCHTNTLDKHGTQLADLLCD